MLVELAHILRRHGRFDEAREVTIRAGARTGERSILADPPGAALQVADDIAQGADARIHEEVAGLRFRISMRSFFQVRADGAEALATLVREAVGSVWDSILIGLVLLIWPRIAATRGTRI